MAAASIPGSQGLFFPQSCRAKEKSSYKKSNRQNPKPTLATDTTEAKPEITQDQPEYTVTGLNGSYQNLNTYTDTDTHTHIVIYYIIYTVYIRSYIF